MIAVIDYGMGNIRSVSKAFLHIEAPVVVTNSPAEILKSNALVVPGVGAFGDCINNLKRLGLLSVIKDFIASGKPYLGLCLGMQILFENSEESPKTPGLAVFKGNVKKFPAGTGLKIPHMGWNTIKIANRKSQIANSMFKDMPIAPYMYFVHSYYVDPKDKSIIAGETDYGIKFCSAIQKDNIWATQFHPEKSQAIGLKILNNFKNLCR